MSDISFNQYILIYIYIYQWPWPHTIQINVRIMIDGHVQTGVQPASKSSCKYISNNFQYNVGITKLMYDEYFVKEMFLTKS
jgi:hypothetical protein